MKLAKDEDVEAFTKAFPNRKVTALTNVLLVEGLFWIEVYGGFYTLFTWEAEEDSPHLMCDEPKKVLEFAVSYFSGK